ncbi:MAG: hypothetical protein A2284_01725 [Deltaproteobacteria bacterium RIFOXYA12_FULL_61_11]|nr:MAG: hypothetical protein A2284_01725 [Deltaproteobacteria bacterium RIFOXYA12_FULL_61_11]
MNHTIYFVGLLLSLSTCNPIVFDSDEPLPWGQPTVVQLSAEKVQIPSGTGIEYGGYRLEDGTVLALPSNQNGEPRLEQINLSALLERQQDLVFQAFPPAESKLLSGLGLALGQGDEQVQLPSGAGLTLSLPASTFQGDRALPSNAIPSNLLDLHQAKADGALPSNAIPSNALPSNLLGEDLLSPSGGEYFLTPQTLGPETPIVTALAFFRQPGDKHAFPLHCAIANDPGQAAQTGLIARCALGGTFIAPTIDLVVFSAPLRTFIQAWVGGVPLSFLPRQLDTAQPNRAPVLTLESTTLELTPGQTRELLLTAEDLDGDFLLLEVPDQVPGYVTLEHHRILLKPTKDDEGEATLSLRCQDAGYPRLFSEPIQLLLRVPKPTTSSPKPPSPKPATGTSTPQSPGATGTCVCEGSGAAAPCCDGCFFRSAGSLCGEPTYSKTCVGSCGGKLMQTTLRKTCTGDRADCVGDVHQPTPPALLLTCSAEESCDASSGICIGDDIQCHIPTPLPPDEETPQPEDPADDEPEDPPPDLPPELDCSGDMCAA